MNEGVQCFPGWLEGSALRDLQQIIGELFQKSGIRETAESGLMEADLRAYAPVQAFVNESRLSQAVGAFVGPRALPRMGYHAHRLYPYAGNGFEAYRWHFDAHPGWPIKAMLLLTDLDEQGQAMEYVKGPPVKRDFQNYDQTRWTEEGPPPGEVVKIVGTAGTLWLFNAWNWHRGMRKMAPIRDTLTVEWLKAV